MPFHAMLLDYDPQTKIRDMNTLRKHNHNKKQTAALHQEGNWKRQCSLIMSSDGGAVGPGAGRRESGDSGYREQGGESGKENREEEERAGESGMGRGRESRVTRWRLAGSQVSPTN